MPSPSGSSSSGQSSRENARNRSPGVRQARLAEVNRRNSFIEENSSADATRAERRTLQNRANNQGRIARRRTLVNTIRTLTQENQATDEQIREEERLKNSRRARVAGSSNAHQQNYTILDKSIYKLKKLVGKYR